MNNEIRNLPESKLSSQQGSYCFFMGWRTDATNHKTAIANGLKTSENGIFDIIYGVVQDESYRTVLEKIGDCPGRVDQRYPTMLYANFPRMGRLDHREIATTDYKHDPGYLSTRFRWRAPLQR